MIHATFKRSNPCKSGNNKKCNYKGNGGNCRTQKKKPKNLPDMEQVSQLQNTKAKDPREEDSDRNDGYHKELEKLTKWL